MEIVRGKRFKSFLEEAEKEKKELAESYEEAKRQTKERTKGPLDNFSKDLKESIKKRTYEKRKDHATDISYENENKK
tara:strand:- start:719 stop:949 length:231 start_codon:yes stop_codon:yes gene_type:complete